MELRGRDISTAANSGLELAVFAVDAKGKVKASSRETLSLNLKPDTKTRVEQSSIRLLSRLNVPPGRYQLRVGAHDVAGGALGSVLYDLDVPDFEKAPLAMSGLVLTSAASSLSPTAKPDADLRQVLPGPAGGDARVSRRTISWRSSRTSTTTTRRTSTPWTSPRR